LKSKPKSQEDQLVRELHFPHNKNKTFLKINVYEPNHIWSADLIFLTREFIENQQDEIAEKLLKFPREKNYQEKSYFQGK